jgi:hypothetical protein
MAGALWFAHKPEAIVHEPRPVSPAPAPTIMPAAAVYESLPTPVQSKPISKPSVQRRHKPAPAPAATRQQVAIKLLTDDPNVIIYWLVDEKGD